MMTFSRMKYIIFAIVVSLCIPSLVFSQEWSSKQNEVWKSVEAHWEKLAEKDLEGFLEYIHPDYTGFTSFQPLPIDKDILSKWLSTWMLNSQLIVYDIEPVTIEVHGDFAIVNYFFSAIEKSSDGKVTKPSRRYSGTWVKQKDKWVVVSAHLEDI